MALSKKTLGTIIETGNDYLVKVKGNQPNLLKAVKQTVETQSPIDSFTSTEKSRGRLEQRQVSVLTVSSNIPQGWTEVNRIIDVTRCVESIKGSYRSHSYYISSVKSDTASYFAKGIRGHWLIENQLNYVKDVLMNEDNSGIKDIVPACNISVFRNIAINIVRQCGFDSVKNASIFFASNVSVLLQFI